MKRFVNIILAIHANPFSVKVVITVILFAALAGSIGILELRTHMNRVLNEELEEKSQAITISLASQSENLMAGGDTASLAGIINNSLTRYRDLSYVLIYNQKGEPIAHSFKPNIPDRVLKLRALTDITQEPEAIPVYTEEGRVLDFAAPIAQGEGGWVQLGMSTKSIIDNINSLSKQLLLTTLVVTILGVFGALVIAHFVTRPIRDLALASTKIAEGDLSQRVTTWGEDELAHLGRTFNQMASSIEKYSKEREALVQELKQNEQIRQELLKKVITAQEDERKRISRELHDETSQSLTSLIIGLKVLLNEEMAEKQIQTISEMKNLASSTLKEVHRLAVELRPTVLDDMGLMPAIERFVKGYSQNYNIDVDVHIQRKDHNRLPGEVETALYRIVQEALTNIIKYAEAKNASVLLDIKKEGVRLIIEDDGIGFDVEKIGQSEDRHLGIAGMKERALLLNGKFTIESNSEQGTTLFVYIPLRREINEITN